MRATPAEGSAIAAIATIASRGLKMGVSPARQGQQYLLTGLPRHRFFSYLRQLATSRSELPKGVVGWRTRPGEVYPAL